MAQQLSLFETPIARAPEGAPPGSSPETTPPPASIPLTWQPLGEAALAALRAARVKGTVVLLGAELPREVYGEVDTALRRIDGRWERRAGGHVFSRDPSARLRLLVAGGRMPADNPHDYFATPDELAAELVHDADIAALPAGSIVLEPSAGTGALVAAILAANPAVRVVAVELDAFRAADLTDRFAGQAVEVVAGQDFLAWRAGPTAVDAVVMNPPFQGRKYLSHLLDAYARLRPGGWLAAIVPAALAWDKTQMAGRVRALIGSAGVWSPNREGAFAPATSIETYTVAVQRCAPGAGRRDAPTSGYPSARLYQAVLILENDGRFMAACGPTMAAWRRSRPGQAEIATSALRLAADRCLADSGFLSGITGEDWSLLIERWTGEEGQGWSPR